MARYRRWGQWISLVALAGAVTIFTIDGPRIMAGLPDTVAQLSAKIHLDMSYDEVVAACGQPVDFVEDING